MEHIRTAGLVLAPVLLTLCAVPASADVADAPEPIAVAATRADPLLAIKRHWILSAEWVTHAPLDIGLQAGLETSIGLRLGAGYGWVPSAFSSVVTRVAASETGFRNG
jgi:hypothetical protein